MKGVVMDSYTNKFFIALKSSFGWEKGKTHEELYDAVYRSSPQFPDISFNKLSNRDKTWVVHALDVIKDRLEDSGHSLGIMRKVNEKNNQIEARLFFINSDEELKVIEKRTKREKIGRVKTQIRHRYLALSRPELEKGILPDFEASPEEIKLKELNEMFKKRQKGEQHE